MSTTVKYELDRLYSELKVNPVMHYGAKAVYIITEVSMYSFALMALVFAFWIPLDPIGYTHAISDAESIRGTYHHDELTAVMITIRTGVITMAVVLVFAALIARKLRKKNDKLLKAAIGIKRLREVTVFQS